MFVLHFLLLLLPPLLPSSNPTPLYFFSLQSLQPFLPLFLSLFSQLPLLAYHVWIHAPLNFTTVVAILSCAIHVHGLPIRDAVLNYHHFLSLENRNRRSFSVEFGIPSECFWILCLFRMPWGKVKEEMIAFRRMHRCQKLLLWWQCRWKFWRRSWHDSLILPVPEHPLQLLLVVLSFLS